MYEIPFDEDAYWERVREAYENPPRPPDWEPDPETDWLFLDEEADDLEREYGCRLKDLLEADLFDILDRFIKAGVEWLSAIWDERLCGIKYTYRPEPD